MTLYDMPKPLNKMAPKNPDLRCVLPAHQNAHESTIVIIIDDKFNRFHLWLLLNCYYYYCLTNQACSRWLSSSRAKCSSCLSARQSQILTSRPLFPKMAQNLDLRCVLVSLSTLGAGAKTRLESRIKKFTPHCVCRPENGNAERCPRETAERCGRRHSSRIACS